MNFHLSKHDRNDQFEIAFAISFKRTCLVNEISNKPLFIHLASGKLSSHENLMMI